MRKKNLTTKRKKTSPPLPLVSRISLKQIRLVHSETNLSVRGGALPKKTGISVNIDFGVAKDDKLLKGDVSCDIDSFYEGEDDPSIFIHCKFQLLYSAQNGKLPTEAKIKKEKQSVFSMLALQAWPYIREHAHSSSLKMGLPAITLSAIVVEHKPDGTVSVSLRPEIKPQQPQPAPT